VACPEGGAEDRRGSRSWRGAEAHQLLSAGQPTTQDPAALIRHAHRLRLTPPQKARQRASVQLVGLRPRARDPVSSGETTTTLLTCGSRIRATSQQQPRHSNATRSDPSRLSASVLTPSGVAGTRSAERTSPGCVSASAGSAAVRARPQRDVEGDGRGSDRRERVRAGGPPQRGRRQERVRPWRSLASRAPELVDELHPVRNPGSTARGAWGAGRRVWWR
jgi:hypothetical protein